MACVCVRARATCYHKQEHWYRYVQQHTWIVVKFVHDNRARPKARQAEFQLASDRYAAYVWVALSLFSVPQSWHVNLVHRLAEHRAIIQETSRPKTKVYQDYFHISPDLQCFLSGIMISPWSREPPEAQVLQTCQWGCQVFSRCPSRRCLECPLAWPISLGGANHSDFTNKAWAIYTVRIRGIESACKHLYVIWLQIWPSCEGWS